ncbi:hypothetical protein [Chitinophaga sp. Cy-1792]|uniref:hypothetical protein n=1 Tax=Chitinophaga sp. Cy-1792 TaxID=2608339 RepID=UPI0014236653|nr:hypothetical protein [Chitinophaga sp. Cy-1792]NIG55261.1 hypothetical protein [Chitinophaga sp. Cy-1792]
MNTATTAKRFETALPRITWTWYAMSMILGAVFVRWFLKGTYDVAFLGLFTLLGSYYRNFMEMSVCEVEISAETIAVTRRNRLGKKVQVSFATADLYLKFYKTWPDRTAIVKLTDIRKRKKVAKMVEANFWEFDQLVEMEEACIAVGVAPMPAK